MENVRQHRITHSDMDVSQSIERFGINDFLSLAEGKAAHPMLLAALKEMLQHVDPNS